MLKKRFFKTKDECEVTFEYPAEGVESVVLVSEHNNWDPIPMKRLKKGTFKTKVRLPENCRTQFRYLIDGETWVNDEEADGFVPNEHGSQNAVVDTATE